MLNDETDFKAILSKGEVTVIAHAVLSSECYGQKFTDIKVSKVYEELLAFKLQERILLRNITILKVLFWEVL